jgi:hypothetical protein
VRYAFAPVAAVLSPIAILPPASFFCPLALATARAAGRILPVAFFPDHFAVEALLDRDLGCLGSLCRQADPYSGGRESGSGQRLECVTP